MYKKIFLISMLIPVLFSCSEETMDKINEDKNHPKDVPSKFILTEAITASAFTVTGSDLAFYSSVYMEHNVGTYGQLYDAELRLGSQIYSSSTYNNSWVGIYQNLFNLKTVIEKCSTGSESDNTKNLGIAQVLMAYNLAVLTDVFGDVPYYEALNPGVIYQPKIDKQDVLYQEIFNLLEDGIANLRLPDSPDLEGQDLIFGGDNEKWMRAAYGLEARYKMRLSLRNADYTGVIAAVDSSFTSAGSEFKFATYDGGTATSPFYAFYNDRDYLSASQSLHDKLTARNDPRDAIFFQKYPSKKITQLYFAPNGSPDPKSAYYGISNLLSPTAPTFLLSYSEVLFLKAEAYARLNDLINAEAQLKLAIQAAFEKVGLDAASADAYFTSNVKARFDADPLLEIGVQKYFSFYQDEALEAYNDYRRLKAMGTDIPLVNTLTFPLRFTYGVSDVTTNINIEDAFGDGTYVKTENVWWAGGTR